MPIYEYRCGHCGARGLRCWCGAAAVVEVVLLEIITYPDPILLREAQTVPRVTRQVRRLARDMLETMYVASGIGLAAPQVGIQQGVIVVDVGDNPITLVNPEVTAAEGKQVGLEGWTPCLTACHEGGDDRSQNH